MFIRKIHVFVKKTKMIERL